jgi:predicted nucleotidyltransferase
MPEETDIIKDVIPRFFPDAQAVYLFGSRGTEWRREDSDIDVAVLLPVETAKEAGDLNFNPCRAALESAAGADVDLVNLRAAPTVLQKEVIAAERLLYCADQSARLDFEALTLSKYQRLNAERAGILEDMTKHGGENHE